MKCPNCGGTGSQTKKGTNCSGDYWYTTNCDLCEGVGAVKFVRTETQGGHYNTCGSCNGTGKVTRSVETGKYPSGQPVYEQRRIKCSSCDGSGKYWVEKTESHYYEPDRNARQGDCFIATASFGDSAHPTVEQLRDFRNRILMQSRVGRYITTIYTRYSPSMAHWLMGHPNLKPLTRWLLGMFARLCSRIRPLPPHDPGLCNRFMTMPTWSDGGGI